MFPSEDFLNSGTLKTTMETILPREIAQAFEPILGRPAWQVKKGHGSFLTLEFGEPSLVFWKPREHRRSRNLRVIIRGDWHLWIYCCNWDIVQNGKHLAHNESDDETIEKATAQIDGQCLERLWTETEMVVTHFKFDLGAVLTTFPYDDDDPNFPYDEDDPYELWSLYEPSGDVLSVRSDSRYCHGPGTTPPNEMRWVSLIHNDA